MPAPYTGRCACGKVTLKIEGEPIAVGQCWCRQCQKIGAGGGTNNALFRMDQVSIAGELATHSYVASSGNTVKQEFCASCGTPIWGQSSARDYICAVKLGARCGQRRETLQPSACQGWRFECKPPNAPAKFLCSCENMADADVEGGARL